MAAGSFVRRCKAATVAVVFPAFAIMLGVPAQVRAGCAPPPIVFSPSTAQSKPQPWAATPQSAVDHNGPGQKLVGLWEDSYTDTNGNPINFYQFELYHDDRTELEVDQSPILTGNVCLGTWKNLQGSTYGLVHPYFFFQDVNTNGEGSENTEGQWDGNSGFYACTITVAIDGNSFQSKCHAKTVVGVDPFSSSATVLSEGDFGIQGKRIGLDQTLLP